MTMAPGKADLQYLCDVYTVSRETVHRLETYGGLLAAWQQKTNLVAPSTLDQFWRRHVADSLQCLALKPETTIWADLGSGGGFPGMAIAVANAGTPERQHHLVESIHKKCAFLREVARQAGARATVHCERIESAAKRIAELPQPPQVVTARALASLDKLLALAEPLLDAGAVALFHKGREFEAELRECNGLWRFDLIVHPSRIEADSVLLEISRLQRK